MEVVAIVLALSLTTNVALCVWYANRRDDREARERQRLLDRIQAPEAAPILSMSDYDTEQLQSVEYDDDEAFSEIRQADRELRHATAE